jgi:hypothetical protein
LGGKKVIAITFPAHISNPLQPWDFVFFGALAKCGAPAFDEFDDDPVNAEIKKFVQAYEQTGTSSVIRTSVKKERMDLEVTTKPFKIRIVERTMRESPDSNKVWHENVSFDDLSRRPPFE